MLEESQRLPYAQQGITIGELVLLNPHRDLPVAQASACEASRLQHIHVRSRYNYSERSATVGSTRIARRAGMKHANNDTAHSSNATPENVTASVLVISQQHALQISRQREQAARPKPTPIIVKRSPCPITSRKMSSRFAPSAMQSRFHVCVDAWCKP